MFVLLRATSFEVGDVRFGEIVVFVARLKNPIRNVNILTI